ncbi:MAG TPA: ArsR family transcriptional regulator [Oceanithermus profundus]|uniref:ArsR family transcriptional regulator n=1 Tax=Oceanithermus profundus TaxID=187137 RepID=A0A7C4ZCA1_9DEIN|nr:ArsR family transcriptional regulator [Oceanithermus profundus]
MKRRATKERILRRLRSRSASASELARELGISKVAVYRHLNDLKRAGLVRVRSERRGMRGRPLNLFEAIDEPTAYARICRELLEQIEDLYGPGAGVRVLRARYREQLSAWKEAFAGMGTEERARKLVDWLTERGYAAVSRREGDELVLEQHRCPNLALAREYRELCQVELEFFGELLGVELEREGSLSEGDPCCRYRVALSPREA